MHELAITAVTGTRTFRVQRFDARAGEGAPLEGVTGAPWPRNVGAVSEGRVRVLCVGPADWYVIAPEAQGDAFLADLARAGAGEVSVVEVSQALPALRLQGAIVRRVLAQGCAVDLHPQAFPPGRCTRTRLAGIPVIVHCIADESSFECYLSRSYVRHFQIWLDGALAQGPRRNAVSGVPH